MPIIGIADLQRRDAQIGEIRIGTSVEATDRSGKPYRKPVRLETFRFTTSDEKAAEAVAERYGGQVAPWPQRKGRWEVVTDRKALDVWVPPQGEAADANMEMWDGPKRQRRCNGITEALSGRPCACPRADDPADPQAVQRARDERKRLAAMRPPQACKPLTRINVTIPDLPGLLGVWRLNSGSENTAVETAAAGDAMVIAREGGVYLPAVLLIQWRYRSADGSPYPVPFLRLGLSMQELSQGMLPSGPGGLLAQLRSTGEQKAIAAGPAAPGTASVPEVPDVTMLDDREPMTAQQIADLAAGAKDRDDIEFLVLKAEEDGVDRQKVRPDSSGPGRYQPMELRQYLRALWKVLPPKADEGAA